MVNIGNQHREMLEEIDVLLIDLQDVGTRIYTYIWTVKLCMEACSEAGIPVWILDRPNPAGCLPFDGPVLKKEYFTFVGGASIPLCHRMTIRRNGIMVKGKVFSRFRAEYCMDEKLEQISSISVKQAFPGFCLHPICQHHRQLLYIPALF